MLCPASTTGRLNLATTIRAGVPENWRSGENLEAAAPSRVWCNTRAVCRSAAHSGESRDRYGDILASTIVNLTFLGAFFLPFRQDPIP
jgi:hypothetical protein